MNIIIKNMVCDRCKMAVKEIFTSHGITPCCIELGYVETKDEIDSTKLDELEIALKSIGFEIIRDKKEQLANEVKLEIIKLLNDGDDLENLQLSEYIGEHLHQDYKNISTIFSQVEGKTIEKYFIQQRIEKVKELIVYNELSLSEIAFKLGFSSVAHLSNQFKQITGMTPSVYKTTIGHREGLDKI